MALMEILRTNFVFDAPDLAARADRLAAARSL